MIYGLIWTIRPFVQKKISKKYIVRAGTFRILKYIYSKDALFSCILPQSEY